MVNIADIIEKKLGKDIRYSTGSGAAGGLGAGLIAFLNAKLQSGQEFIIKLSDFDKKVRNADLVITGEGKLDKQTLLFKKAPAGIAEFAKRQGIPCYCIAGMIDANVQYSKENIFDECFSLCNNNVSKSNAILSAKTLLSDVAAKATEHFLHNL